MVPSVGDDEYNLGLEALGYPPTWARNPSEFLTITKALESSNV